MKKLWLILFISLFLFVGCGLETAAENTTSNMSQSRNQFDEFQATSVWTDMRPIPNTPMAGVVFEIETTLESGKPITLYGGGTLTVNEEGFTIEHGKLIRGQGQGIVKVYAAGFNETDPSSTAVIRPHISNLTAQIDGLKAGPTDITIEGIVIATNENEETLAFPDITVSDNSEVQEVSCYGRFLPDSSIAQMIVLGESDMRVSGLVDLGKDFTPPSSNPGPFTCAIGSKATVTATDASVPGTGTSVVVVDLERVTFNFLESNQTYQVESASGYMLGLSLE